MLLFKYNFLVSLIQKQENSTQIPIFLRKIWNSSSVHQQKFILMVTKLPQQPTIQIIRHAHAKKKPC